MPSPHRERCFRLRPGFGWTCPLLLTLNGSFFFFFSFFNTGANGSRRLLVTDAFGVCASPHPKRTTRAAFGFSASAAATGRRRSALSRLTMAFPLADSSLSEGDTVVIVGGTSGVGQLVTQILGQQRRSSKYKVRVTARNVEAAKEALGQEDGDCNVEVVQVPSLIDAQLATPKVLDRIMEGASAVIISVGTTAFPTLKWQGGNTPKAIDQEAVGRIVEAASRVSGLKRVVLLTSIGVTRTDSMPFVILNLFGVLDAKKAGEEKLKQTADSSNFDYVIVRPGRLVGGPYTNIDFVQMFQIEGGEGNGLTVEAGDSLLGDCKRLPCAEAVVQCLENKECRNIELSLVSNEERTPFTVEEWTSEFARLRASS